MAMASEEAEVDTDMDLMLSCLEEASEDVIIQALQTISTMCNNLSAQSLFQRKGGVSRIWSLLKRTKQSSVRQCALFSLGCAVERNVNSQMALCKLELFQLLTSFLHDPHESLTVKCTAAFLANTLVCNNSTGQRLARETTLLKTLMDIFRSLCEQRTTLSDLDSASFNLLAAVCTALSAAVNNPENVDNQRCCCSLFPAIAGIIPCLTTAMHLSPVLGFLNACATSHYMNQERVRVVGVLTALVNGLQRSEPLNEQTGQDASSSVLLVDALVHCSNVNKNNQERLVEMGVVPVLVQLLGQTEEASMLLKVVTCLQLLTAENVGAQHQLQMQGGVAPLIRVMAESQESDLKQVAVLVLRSCLGEKPSTVVDLPEADVAIQRLQCLLDKLDSFERSNQGNALQTTGANMVVKRMARKAKECDATLKQSVAITNKRVTTMKQADASIRQKDATPRPNDAIHWGSESALQHSSPSVASPKSELASDETSPEVPHNNVLHNQHGRGTVVASSLPSGSGTHKTSELNPASKSPKTISDALPMTTGSQQLQQITSSLQQIQSDLQTLEHMHRTSQVSVHSKLQTLEGSLKSLEGNQCAHCSPQPQLLSTSSCKLLSIPKTANASFLAAGSSKVLGSMPPPKTLPHVKTAHHRPHRAGVQDKSQQLSVQSQKRKACFDSRRFASVAGTTSGQVGRRDSRYGSCAMCAATSLHVPHLTSRSLLKVVYNSSHSCPVHEDFAKWAFTTKQKRSFAHSLCESTTSPATSLHCRPVPVLVSPADTPHSLPSSVATVSQDCALQELALNESYIIHKTEKHCTTAMAARRNVPSAVNGPSWSTHAPLTAPRVPTPSRDAGPRGQQMVLHGVSSNVERCSRNFKHTPAKNSRVRDVFDFDSPESSPDAENRPPLKGVGGIKLSKEHTSVKRKHRTPFTLKEEDYVIQGVAKFGKRWRHVLSSFPFRSCRTVVDIKDKYRNLKAKGIAPRS